LNNAAKYTPPGGQIEVRVEARDRQLMVAVRDSGTGIAPEMLHRVFELFAQASHPLERSQGGLGIGLSLVRGLVQLHGGTVEARSEGIGRGSEFIVYLPRQPVDAEALSNSPSAESQREELAGAATAQARRVLVVDDNVDAAEMVAELLRMFGNDVAVAHDGSSAVKLTAELRPDVVLLDIGLPDINGHEVARRIRRLEKVRQPLLIALTGWGQKQDRLMSAEAGFDQHWTKPVDPARLQELSSR
jgi:CheY-like chemotaxis protein